MGFGFHGVAKYDTLLSTSCSERFMFSVAGSEESRSWLVGVFSCSLLFSLESFLVIFSLNQVGVKMSIWFRRWYESLKWLCPRLSLWTRKYRARVSGVAHCWNERTHCESTHFGTTTSVDLERGGGGFSLHSRNVLVRIPFTLRVQLPESGRETLIYTSEHHWHLSAVHSADYWFLLTWLPIGSLPIYFPCLVSFAFAVGPLCVAELKSI